MRQQNWLRRLFGQDPAVEERGFQQLVIAVLGISLTGAVLLALLDIDRPVMMGLSAVLLVALVLAWRGIALPGRLLSPLAGLIVFGFLMFSHYGIRDTAVVGLTLTIVLATLLIGANGMLVYGALALVLVIAVGIAELGGWLQTPFSAYNTLADYTVVAIGIIVVSMAQWLVVRRLNESFQRARRNEQAQIEANRELEALRASLQARVDESTAHLRAATDASRSVVSLLDPEQLLLNAVEFIHQRFGMYWVGLFRLEEGGEWAVLRASAGRVEESWPIGHRLPVDSHSLIGACIVGRRWLKAEDEAKLDGAPGASAGAVLPLQSRGEILGVLAVYTDRPPVLDDSLLSALTIIADQVVVALDNALLFQRLEESLDAERRIYGQQSTAGWQQMFRAQSQVSVMSGAQGAALTVEPLRPEMKLALQQRETTVSIDEQGGLALPIRVRDQVIGVVGGRKPAGAGRWSEEEIQALQTLTEQLGVALESARLYQDTQQRAARERLIGEVTARMRETLDIETVLKTTASEMRQALDLDKLVIRLVTPETDGASEPA